MAKEQIVLFCSPVNIFNLTLYTPWWPALQEWMLATETKVTKVHLATVRNERPEGQKAKIETMRLIQCLQIQSWFLILERGVARLSLRKFSVATLSRTTCTPVSDPYPIQIPTSWCWQCNHSLWWKRRSLTFTCFCGLFLVLPSWNGDEWADLDRHSHQLFELVCLYMVENR